MRPKHCFIYPAEHFDKIRSKYFILDSPFWTILLLAKIISMLLAEGLFFPLPFVSAVANSIYHLLDNIIVVFVERYIETLIA